MDLEASARTAGAYRWVESALFEVLGGWVPSATTPDVKLMLDRHSAHHAWRAQQWWDRLPVLADVDRDGLVAPPSIAWEAACEALRHLDGDVARLAGAYRSVLPRLAGDYERMRGELTDVSDRAMTRALGIVSADLHADWREGESTLQGLLVDKAAITSASDAAVSLETTWLAG